MISKTRRLQRGQHELLYSEVKDAHINESTIATPCKNVRQIMHKWKASQEHEMSHKNIKCHTFGNLWTKNWNIIMKWKYSMKQHVEQNVEYICDTTQMNVIL